MNSKSKIYDVVVIGMGASGLFALANIDSDIKAIGLEAGPSAGRKLLLTGGGRCNLTNKDKPKDFVDAFDKASFVRPIIYSFNNKKLIEWFEKRGFALSEEEGKIYPKSKKSESVLNCLLSEIKGKKHDIIYSERVLGISNYGEDLIKIKGSKSEYLTQKVIIAVGGATYPFTGSDGQFLKSNFDIVPFSPAMCPIYISKNPFSELRGVSVKGVSLKYGKSKFYGDILFAGKFLSGPVIMDLSNHISLGEKFTIDFLPEFSREEIKKIFIAALLNHPKKFAKGVLEGSINLPSSLCETLCNLVFDSDTRSANLETKDINRLVENIKTYTCEVSGKGALKNAIVSKGGIAIETIDNLTMSLKIDPRVAVIGEALDVVGHCGGYNLQFAFSSAMRSVSFLK